MRLRPTLALYWQLGGNLGYADHCHVDATLPTLAARYGGSPVIGDVQDETVTGVRTGHDERSER